MYILYVYRCMDLTGIRSEAEVAPPVAGVNEHHKWVDVRSTYPAPHYEHGVNDRAFLGMDGEMREI